jgi:hypothetical protein
MFVWAETCDMSVLSNDWAQLLQEGNVLVTLPMT